MRKTQVEGPDQGAAGHTLPTVPDDGKVHVPKILTPDPAILPWKAQRAIEYYLDMPERDLTTCVDVAGRKAGMAPNEFRAYFNQPAVQEIIKKKADLIDQAVAERRAAARVLTEDFIDAQTVALLDAPGEKATSARVRMLEIAYKRFGMLIEKHENSGAGGAPMAFQIIRLGQKKEQSA